MAEGEQITERRKRHSSKEKSGKSHKIPPCSHHIKRRHCRKRGREEKNVVHLTRLIHRGPKFEVWSGIGGRSAAMAVKLISPKLEGKEKIINKNVIRHEAELLRSLPSHPHIISFYSYCDQSTWMTKTSIYETSALVVELGEFDILEVLKFSKGFTEGVAYIVSMSLLSAIKHLHSEGVAHVDIKPEQLVVTSKSVVKLIDFGTGSRSQFVEKPTGTEGYLAPEMMNVRYKKRVDLLAADMWSIGVVIFTLVCGFPPFRVPSLQDPLFSLFHKKRRKFWMLVRSRGIKISSLAQKFIDDLLKVPTGKRLTAPKALTHQWMQRHQLLQEQNGREFRILLQKYRSSMKGKLKYLDGKKSGKLTLVRQMFKRNCLKKRKAVMQNSFECARNRQSRKVVRRKCSKQ